MKNFKTNRTEAVLSLVVTTALVITLAITIASSIKKGSKTAERENIVNLNETETPSLSARNSTSELATKTPDDTSKNHSKTTPDQMPTTPLIEDTTASKENELPIESDIEVISPKSVGTLYSFSEADTLAMPLNGSIVLDYNMDNTIWFPTLGVYKCNPGIYIGAEVGQSVTSSSTGKVESIFVDEEMGNSILVDLGNGYKATYGGLNDIQVLEGELIFAGSPLGTVAQPTSYFTVEGSGIYFKLTKDGIPENPFDYME